MSGMLMMLKSMGLDVDDMQRQATALNDRVLKIESGIRDIQAQNAEILSLLKGQNNGSQADRTAAGTDDPSTGQPTALTAPQ